MPPQHLSLGFAGGGLSSLLIQLFRDWSHSVPGVGPGPHLVEPVIERLVDCHCSVFASWDLSERDLGILLVGILLGLLLLPILEFLLVLRQAWSVWLRTWFLGSASAKQLYRAV